MSGRNPIHFKSPSLRDLPREVAAAEYANLLADAIESDKMAFLEAIMTNMFADKRFVRGKGPYGNDLLDLEIIDPKGTDELTPLMRACQQNNENMALWLIVAGAKPSAVEAIGGAHVIHIAVQNPLSKTLRYLLHAAPLEAFVRVECDELAGRDSSLEAAIFNSQGCVENVCAIIEYADQVALYYRHRYRDFDVLAKPVNPVDLTADEIAAAMGHNRLSRALRAMPILSEPVMHELTVCTSYRASLLRHIFDRLQSPRLPIELVEPPESADAAQYAIRFGSLDVVEPTSPPAEYHPEDTL